MSSLFQPCHALPTVFTRSVHRPANRPVPACQPLLDAPSPVRRDVPVALNTTLMEQAALNGMSVAATMMDAHTR